LDLLGDEQQRDDLQKEVIRSHQVPVFMPRLFPVSMLMAVTCKKQPVFQLKPAREIVVMRKD
jgi:hypothetical protein